MTNTKKAVAGLAAMVVLFLVVGVILGERATTQGCNDICSEQFGEGWRGHISTADICYCIDADDNIKEPEK